jgi:hypothetical protein
LDEPSLNLFAPERFATPVATDNSVDPFWLSAYFAVL